MTVRVGDERLRFTAALHEAHPRRSCDCRKSERPPHRYHQRRGRDRFLCRRGLRSGRPARDVIDILFWSAEHLGIGAPQPGPSFPRRCDQQPHGHWADAVDDTEVLSRLPERFWRYITPGFANRFAAVAVNLTARVSNGWASLGYVADELALKCLLDDGGCRGYLRSPAIRVLAKRTRRILLRRISTMSSSTHRNTTDSRTIRNSGLPESCLCASQTGSSRSMQIAASTPPGRRRLMSPEDREGRRKARDPSVCADEGRRRPNPRPSAAP